MIFELEPRKIGRFTFGSKIKEGTELFSNGHYEWRVLLDRNYPSGDSNIPAGVWLWGVIANPFSVELKGTFPGVPDEKVTTLVGYQINTDLRTRDKFLYVPPVPLRGVTTYAKPSFLSRILGQY